MPINAAEKNSEKAPVNSSKDELNIVRPASLEATLVFTGFLNGYVEPCGCAGLENMKGGLGRRHSLVKKLRDENWQPIPIDAGNLNKGGSTQEEQKFQFVTEEAMRLMRYEAVGLGNHEMLLPATTLLLYTADTAGNPKRYTSANVGLFEFDAAIVAPYRIACGGNVNVGVISVVAPSLNESFNNSQVNNSYGEDILFAAPQEKIAAALKKINAAHEVCDFRVLIVHGTQTELEKIVSHFPRGTFQFVMTSETPAEPPFAPRKLLDDAWLIEVGLKGSHVVLAMIEKDATAKDVTAKNTTAKWKINFARVALDSRWETSSEMFNAMQSYQDYLKEVGFAGLGLRPMPPSDLATRGKFVGSRECRTCHEISYEAWRNSRHSTAMKSLTETSRPARQYDPECISCHVDGWNPQEMFPYTSGYLSQELTPALASVGCESCHGAGELHIAAETNGTENAKTRQRLSARLTLEAAKKTHCTTCHDHDNSPKFEFDSYWEKIRHRESEE